MNICLNPKGSSKKTSHLTLRILKEGIPTRAFSCRLWCFSSNMRQLLQQQQQFVTSCSPPTLQSAVISALIESPRAKIFLGTRFQSLHLDFLCHYPLHRFLCICHQCASSQMSSSDPYPFNPPSQQMDEDARLIECLPPRHNSVFCLSWEFMLQTHPESCNPSKSICYCSASSRPMSVSYQRWFLPKPLPPVNLITRLTFQLLLRILNSEPTYPHEFAFVFFPVPTKCLRGDIFTQSE